MRVERITTANIALLDRVADDVFDAEIDPALARQTVAHKDILLFVALGSHPTTRQTTAPEVIGQCLAYVLHSVDRAPSLLIENLGVAPKSRRHGIGQALLRAACDAGEKLGADYMWLGSDPESDTADAFYDGIGLPLQSARFTEVDLPWRAPAGAQNPDASGI